MAKYKVGDKVKIRSDLVERDTGACVIEEMLQFKGMEATIIRIEEDDYYSIDLDDDTYYWDDDAFEPIDFAHDPVNSPSHYTHGGMECIDEMIALYGVEEVKSFCKLNVHKYRKRALYKNGEEDMKKSNWYMNKYVELKNYDKKSD